MKIVADECVDRCIVEALRTAGNDVNWIAESTPSVKDPDVLDTSTLANALLVTSDLDFGELVYRQKKASCGVVLLRLAGLSSKLKSEIVCQAFLDHEHEFWFSFTVIDPGAIRIRRQMRSGI